jgi:hypothetical protein
MVGFARHAQDSNNSKASRCLPDDRDRIVDIQHFDCSNGLLGAVSIFMQASLSIGFGSIVIELSKRKLQAVS